jgi:hypothetical protein
MKTNKVTLSTAQSLMMVAINKCASCNYSNICVHVMRERCIQEVLEEQLKIK